MRKNNRIVKALLAALLCTFMVTACANTSSKESAAVETKAVETTAAETTAEQKSTTRKVTDMKGVEVEIPMEVNTYVESYVDYIRYSENISMDVCYMSYFLQCKVNRIFNRYES